MTKIIKCTCAHGQQDKLHGKQMRVFNLTTKKIGDAPVYRCTVCEKEKTQ